MDGPSHWFQYVSVSVYYYPVSWFRKEPWDFIFEMKGIVSTAQLQSRNKTKILFFLVGNQYTISKITGRNYKLNNLLLALLTMLRRYLYCLLRQSANQLWWTVHMLYTWGENNYIFIMNQ